MISSDSVRALKHPSLDRLELADIMFALSDPARIDIVRALARSKQPLTCQQLTGERAKSTMSRHFQVLRDSGVIHTDVDGKEHLNTLREAEMERYFPGLPRSILRLLRHQA